jgi:hypothetical protein
MQPLLSFAIPARNDNYQGNSTWRLETTINYLALQLEKLGRLNDAEMVILDWCSPEPVHTSLSLTEQAKKISRFILVPASVINEMHFDDDFPRPIVINAGIRRSRGTYIIQTIGDVLWPKSCLEKIFDIIDKQIFQKKSVHKTLFVIGRKEIPYSIASTCPALSFLEKFVEENDEKIPLVPPFPYIRVPGDGLLMHKNLWFESHGFDERLQYWGWSDCDVILRIQLKYDVVCAKEDKDLAVYHLNHISPENESQILKRKTNPWFFNPLVVNDNDWGLGTYSFNEMPPSAPIDSAATYITTGGTEIVRWYRFVHFMNILKFAFTNLNKAGFAMTYRIVINFLEDARHYGICGRVLSKMVYYCRRLKRSIKNETKQFPSLFL